MDRTGSGILTFALRDLVWRYAGADFELRVDELAARRGEAVACIGPSGCGKTTLVHLIAGILVSNNGTVQLDGTDLSTLNERERRARRIRTIGMVFQEFELLEYLSALDNILLPYHVADELQLDADVRGRARELASEMGISDLLARKPKKLSQGERQRVALCRALVTQPKLLICDEPTGNLDPKNAETIVELLLRQAREHAATVFMVTHDHGLLKRFDRVVDVRNLNGRDA
ncbi:MAG: ABC transporter ATP-binding protein [Planctomycetes bacterium]|jgi:putative ABC transport system ATP-binding protein|nr:ABC transporter ATP-binding protein [Planctomycetota bacterium]